MTDTSAPQAGDSAMALLAMWKDMHGRRLGNFRLIKPIAAGGMGAVFFARKEAFGRFSQPAAVKLVHPHFAHQKDFVDMFLDEARIASCVQHPNVCRVLDFGVADGTYFLAMEYVLGETWGELFARVSKAQGGEPALPVLAAYVLAQACEGLHAAHVARGEDGQPLQIVHRDVSPQNIFVAYDGTVRLIDFGVARAAERLTTTRAGVVKGKLAYMAPEQIRGGALDGRVDIWALGVILREALEGKRLFRRESDTETLRAVVSEPLPPWSAAAPPELRAIVERALARDPEARYPSARELGLALSRYVESQRPPFGGPELSLWMHRLFADQLELKRALMHVESAPEAEPVEARGSAREQNNVEGTPGSGPAPADEPEIEADAEPTRAPRARQAAIERGDVTGSQKFDLAAPPLLSLRSARLQRRVGLGLVALGAVVLGLAGLLAYRRLAGPEEPRTVALVRPSAPPPAPTAALQVTPEPPPRAPAAGEPAAAAPPPAEPASASASAAPDADEPPTSASEPSRKRGTLLIAFPSGWAEVYLGRRKLGTTPGKFKLQEGTHTLLILPFGKPPGYTRRVTVESGAPQKLIL
jgi:serine/threonine-protein kinase